MIREMSAEELEEQCQKYIKAEVSDIHALVLVLDKMGIRIISALNEQEYYAAYSYTENGVTTQEAESKNPNYLSGTKRKVYEFLYEFTSGGQVFQTANMEAEHPGHLALYDGLILVASTVGGVMAFRRKDLK